MAIIDLDHFKAVNDRYGHPAGDEVLVEVARRLTETLTSASHVGRVGGEEFAALFPRPGEWVAAECELAVVLINHEPIVLSDGGSVRVSVSVGLADVDAASGPMAAYRRADEMLYHAKHAGRNRLRVA
jgi:diguanylate cyclase (GGDEF)-like protein